MTENNATNPVYTNEYQSSEIIAPTFKTSGDNDMLPFYHDVHGKHCIYVASYNYWMTFKSRFYLRKYNYKRFSLFKDSGTSEDSNYESMQLYEEIDSLRGSPVVQSHLSDDILYQQKNKSILNRSLPPSILRPPDISEVILGFCNQDTIVEKYNDLRSNSNNEGIPRSIIPRPKVGWPSRKVTFGKLFFILIYYPLDSFMLR